MRLEESVYLVMSAYPKVLAACHEAQTGDGEALRGLTKRQMEILEVLQESIPFTVRQLAEQLGVTSSTISIGIEKLSRRGLVDRVPAKKDRRFVAITLSTKGAQVKASQQLLSRRLLVRLLESLSQRERDITTEAFMLLSRAAQQMLDARQART